MSLPASIAASVGLRADHRRDRRVGFRKGRDFRKPFDSAVEFAPLEQPRFPRLGESRVVENSDVLYVELVGDFREFAEVLFARDSHHVEPVAVAPYDFERVVSD